MRGEVTSNRWSTRSEKLANIIRPFLKFSIVRKNRRLYIPSARMRILVTVTCELFGVDLRPTAILYAYGETRAFVPGRLNESVVNRVRNGMIFQHGDWFPEPAYMLRGFCSLTGTSGYHE